MNSANENYLYATHAPLGGLTGILAQLVDYIVSTAIEPQPALAAGASLCALGALMGQRYQTETGLRPNLYLIGVSPPNSGKTHVLEALNDLFIYAGLQDYLSTSITGKAQLDKELMRRPCLLWQYDDCAPLLQKAARMPVLVHDLSRLFKGNGKYNTTAKKGRYHVIQQTGLCLSGMTTPEHLQDAINKKNFLDSVIAGKTIIMPSCGGHEASQGGAPDSSRQALIDGLREIALGTPELGHSHQLGIPEPLTVACTGEARAVLIDYSDICWRLVKDGGNDRILNRLAEQAAKIALILAVSDCHSQPLINVRHMRWAIDVVNVSARWQLDGRRTGLGERQERVLNVIMASAEGLNGRELYRKTQWLTKVEREGVLASLESLGLILRKQGAYGGRGRRSLVVTAVLPTCLSGTGAHRVFWVPS